MFALHGINNPFSAPGADTGNLASDLPCTSLAPPQGGGTMKKKHKLNLVILKSAVAFQLCC